MKIEHTEPGLATLTLSTDDLWSLRHCAIEALEALGRNEVEFRVRVGAPVADAEALVRDLKEVAKLTEVGARPPSRRQGAFGETGGMGGQGQGRRVAWDMDAYVARVRAGCFVCELLAGAAGYEHDVVWRDEVGVAFLAKYPVAWGHVLVAPVEHREHAVGDFDLDGYLDLQRLVHRVGTALSAVVETERLYVLSLGSQQGNRHVHWHLVPLPPGVLYEDQQTELFDPDRGWLEFDPDDLARLATALRHELA